MESEGLVLHGRCVCVVNMLRYPVECIYVELPKLATVALQSDFGAILTCTVRTYEVDFE